MTYKSKSVIDNLDLHGERAALRGNPSFVWRAGQDRRLEMILRLGNYQEGQPFARVLDNGCGRGHVFKGIATLCPRVGGKRVGARPSLSRWQKWYQKHTSNWLSARHCLTPMMLFELILSHEVLEHVYDDRQAAVEMVRVLKPGYRAVIFAPNRLAPFETHGHYWRGEYHFGNTPLINYLPDPLRNRLAPHVRAYTSRGLRNLFIGLPVRIVHHTQVFPGWDNIVARRPALGKWLRRITYGLENSPLRWLALSHLLVIEKV